MVAGLFQLNSQISQFLSVGSIVVCHILHQRHQLFHGSVLAPTGATCAAAAAIMAVRMGRAMIMEMLMVVGMAVFMGVLVGVGMGMGNAVVGMLMGMLVLVGMATGNMIVMDMHKGFLRFFFYYIGFPEVCQFSTSTRAS